MRKRIRILVAALLIVFVIPAFSVFSGCDFNPPPATPPEIIVPPEEDKGVENPNGALFISKDGGVYAAGFKLTVSSKNTLNKIYYTVDSSEPTDKSKEFPVDGLDIKSGMSSSYPLGSQVEGVQGAGSYSMLHSTTVRLLEVDKTGKSVATKTVSYLITTEAAITGCPVIFLTVPTVTKSAANTQFMGWRDRTNTSNVYNLYPPWESSPNNSKVRPECWGSIEYHNPDGESFTRSAKIKVGGSGSVQNSMRTLNINFNKDALGNKNDRVKTDVFNGADKNDGTGKLTNISRFRLHGGGSNYARAGLSSAFVDTVAGKMDTTAIIAKYGRPCHTFINGEYWGVYYTREHISDVFFADNYSLNKDNVIYMDKGYATDTGSPPDSVRLDGIDYRTYGFSIGDAIDEETAWKALGALHADDLYYGNFANDAVYDKFCSLVDVTSLADCMLIQGFTGNWDYGDNNVRLWRSEMVETGNPYADTKWRFIVHDTDYCFEPSSDQNRRVSGSDKYGSYTEIDRYVNTYAGFSHEDYYLFQAPMQNKKFRALLLERAEYICDFFRQNALLVLDTLMDADFNAAYPMQAARWGITGLSSLRSTMQLKASLAVSQGTPTGMDDYRKAVQNTINRCIDKYGA